jgi:hypothetical protein
MQDNTYLNTTTLTMRTQTHEEYAVEAIVDHFREHGMNYYVVKWEGYEDSHDWLPEVDLGGAADLVTEYKERIGWENKKVRMR